MDINDVLNHCMLVDQLDLESQYLQIMRIEDATVRSQKLARWQQKAEHSLSIRTQRQENLPPLTYPDLPIVQQKQKIIAALQQHSVIIIAGETGSGKTTQLPKICLEAGLGLRGFIGHTQPRRIAARTVATRIAQEMQSELGTLVGCKVRFADKTSSQNYIKIMTDGILLAETQNDKWLLHYECIIIDEAHERSLNIDFLLGWLKNLLTKRPTLKVIVTSATIDIARFSQFFNQAPIIEVSGRTYPVELNYLTEDSALTSDDPIAQVVQITAKACDRGRGDILIFQTGEKEIRDVIEALQAQFQQQAFILALYARQSMAEQQKVFQSSGRRKIIVATNVAETSLTLANIQFVIDAGMARLSRYNYRSKIQRLPIEPISQASANQRAGRCGRTGPGICYRLFTEEDFLTRPVFTEPEILRTNLAAVILKMLALNFKEIESFPFIDPPDKRYIKDGLMLLERLQAVDEHKQITPLGCTLANIPIEPKLARMLIGAQHYHALKEVLIIVSALSINDPRERPSDMQAKADAAHAKFTHENSDFMVFLNLWEFITDQKKNLSNTQFRKLCRENFLSFMRICEWFDVHEQLQEQVQELNFKINQVPADYAAIHKSLLTGLVDSIGFKEDKKEYLGARGTKFFVHPASVLFKKTPSWLMACEILHTSKTFARTNAQIESRWLEEVAGHLLKRQYFEPHYVAREGYVLAFEKATLFGLEVISKRKVNYENKFPQAAREVFIQSALVQEQLHSSCVFYQKNKSLIAYLMQLESRLRRTHYILDEQRLYKFYDEQLPSTIASQKALEAWCVRHDQSLLCVDEQTIATISLTDEFYHQYPSHLEFNGEKFALEYLFDLTATDDGMTLIVPLETLLFLKDKDFSWLIPGWLPDKIEMMVKALPKQQRVLLSLPGLLIKAKRLLIEQDKEFNKSFALFLRQEYNLTLSPDTWLNLSLPSFLIMHFKIIYQNKHIAKGDNLLALYESLKEPYHPILQEKLPIERQLVTTWDFGDLPAQVSIVKNQLNVAYFVALVDDVNSVSIQLFDTPKKAQHHHPLGLTRLFLLQLNDATKSLKRNVTPLQKKSLSKLYSPFGDGEQLWEEIGFIAAYDTFVSEQPQIRDQNTFAQQLAKKRSSFLLLTNSLIAIVLEILTAYDLLNRKLMDLEHHAAFNGVVITLKQQLNRLLPQHFIRQTPVQWLKRYPLYLKAMLLRLEKFPRQIARDKEGQAEIDLVLKNYLAKCGMKEMSLLTLDDPLWHFQWRLEELYISLFAQTLGTVEAVSKMRLLKLLESF